MPLPSWHYLARSLEAAGEVARAYSVLEGAASEGSTEALVSLAQLKWKRAEFHEAAEDMERAEARVEEDDWEAHFAMHLVYAIGIGGDDYVQVKERAFKHLIAAAKASGQANMAFSVGLHYWHGLNMVEKDAERAEQWLSMAATSGDKQMITQYKRLKRIRTKSSKDVA
jgi:TPR repeat protein